VCAGDSVELSAPAGTGYNYLWNTGATTQNITVTQSGNYSVTITSAALCNGIGEIEVSIFSEASVTISPDTSVSLGFSTVLTATGGIGYVWSPAETLNDAFIASPSATPLQNTTYSVTVTVADGCITTREVTVSVVEDFRVDVPNLFTPNGDGINDYWVIANIFTYNAEVFVFNRWGSEVFSTTNYQNDWNGVSADGDPLSDGTYYYVVKVGDKVYKGAITILR
jgi:gliding motility-associated-like protein